MDGDWHNPLNWDGDVLPAESDDVTIGALAPGAALGITIGAGRLASVASLDLGKALTVAGVLDVAERTHVRGVAWTIVQGGEAATADLTLEAFEGGSESAGLWTISGESRIGREIRTSGTLTLAENSETVLGDLDADRGVGVVSTGVLRVGDGASVLGTGAALAGEANESVLSGSMSLGAMARLEGLVVRAIGTEGDPALVKGSATLSSELVDCLLDLAHARVTGDIQASGTDLRALERVFLRGRMRFDLAEVLVQGRLESVHSAGEANSLEFYGALIELDGTGAVASEWGANATLVDSTVTIAEEALIDAWWTLDSSAIDGEGVLLIGGVVRLSESVIGAGLEMRPAFGASASLTFQGPGVNTIGGRIIWNGEDRLFEPRVQWTGGDIVLEGEAALLHAGAYAEFTASPIEVGASISGEGTLRLGWSATFRPSSTMSISSTLDADGTVSVVGGTLVIAGRLEQIEIVDAATRPRTPWNFGQTTSTRLNGGGWYVGMGQIKFPRRIDWNRASITLASGGSMPDIGQNFMGGQLHNEGMIELEGQGGAAGMMGNGRSTRISNAGTIIARQEADWTLLGQVWNIKGASVQAVGTAQLTFRAKRFINNGRVLLYSPHSSAGAQTNLTITGNFVQRSGATMWMAIIHTGTRFRRPELDVGGVMTLGGKLRVYSPGAIPGALGDLRWRAADAGKGRVGQFGKIVSDISPQTARVVYDANGFDIMRAP